METCLTRYSLLLLLLLATLCCPAPAQTPDLDFLNHNQPMLDAHNCYPYDGQWNDRIQRALRSGFPVSIEQDLAWYVDPATHQGRVVVSHTPQPSGAEPTLEDYFFQNVRPVVEKILTENRPNQWPLIVLHFDFKDNQAPLLQAVWQILGQHQAWLSTAVKTADPAKLSPIDRKPILVITEDNDAQQQVFSDAVPVGGRLLPLRLRPHPPRARRPVQAAARPLAGHRQPRRAGHRKAHQLPPLVEQLLVRGRGGRRTRRR